MMTDTASPTHTDLATLEANAFVQGVYSLINPQIGTTRNGKPYLKCLIRDASGEVAARQWSFEDGDIGALSATGFVYIAGHTQLYNGQVQLILEQIESREVSESEIAALLPTTKRNIDEMFTEVKAILGTLEHPAMRALADAYLNDDDLMTNFRFAPAAMSLHHAWIGGLLEHTLQLLKIAEVTLPLYPQLNRDIILMGLFLHDLAKTSELTWERGFGYTDDGNLIGHVVRGVIWLQFKAAVAGRDSGERLSAEALRILQHIIISHHGKPEYGAAKIPATPEAIFVSQLDDLDAKTQLALTLTRDERSEHDTAEFTDKIWALDSVRLYKPDPLAD
ncbi:MAG: HD domain-containing protein [Phycisphaerales bacterium]|nr:HD domain-containing protein [Phycisphaerales bacterium]